MSKKCGICLQLNHINGMKAVEGEKFLEAHQQPVVGHILCTKIKINDFLKR